jgi:hypothetical protein
MNKKAKGAQIQTEGLEEQNEIVAVEIEATDEQVAQFSDRKWLENNPFEAIPELTSTKYDVDREPKVQQGIEVLRELMGDKINPLVLLLGKFWENKAARKAIKKLIDDEAATKNQPEDVYLQVTLRENVDKLAAVQSAVDRMRYAITYFKPRGGIGNKAIFKPLRIDGVDYNVNLAVLAEAKEKFGEDKAAIKTFVVERSEKIEIEEYL